MNTGVFSCHPLRIDGALTGVHRVTVGQLVEAEVNGQPVLNCSTTLAS